MKFKARRMLLAAALTAGVVFYLALCVHSGGGVVQSTDSGISEELAQKYVKEAEADNAVRLQRVQEVCHRHNLGLYKHSSKPPDIKHPPTPQYGVFYIDRAHGLSWCPVYKAASTSWLYNLLLLGGYSEGELQETRVQLSDLARRVYPELEASDAEQAFRDTLKMIVVRHPFERLLSAYRDKLENIEIGREHGTLHYYRKYGRHIVKKYRIGGNTTHTQTLLRPGQYEWDPDLPQPLGIEPTFKEFVRYLINTDLVFYSDDHWIPIYLFCTPCLLKYDVIAKVETLLRDQVYVIRSAQLQHLIQPSWRHKTFKGSSVGNSTAKKYFSQLNKQDILKLYDKYKLDFELFDYKIDKYLSYANDGS